MLVCDEVEVKDVKKILTFEDVSPHVCVPVPRIAHISLALDACNLELFWRDLELFWHDLELF